MVDFGDMSRKKVFEDTKWLMYACCGGEGIGAIQPLVLMDQKQLCIHGQSGTADCVGDQGLCAQMATELCFTMHCALPPAKGTYPCIICNKKIGEKRSEGTTLNTEIFDIDKIMDTPFWCIYCFCGGQGLNAPKAAGPCLAAQFKEFCCQGATICEEPVSDGVCCSQLGTCLCCWNECSMPPAAGNPKCAICTWKLNKDHGEADSSPPGKPVPKEM